MNPHVELTELAQCADGTLSETRAARVREHLAECRSCMAAYADAVRYRAAWLADPGSFRLEGDDRRLAREESLAAWSADGTRRGRFPLFRVALASAVVLMGAIVGLRAMNAAPTLGFKLSPAVLDAAARSSALGLVLPGAEDHADQFRPELRSGPPSSSLELDAEVKSAVGDYERGSRGPVSGARVVAALLATGEIDAARDYARECLRQHSTAVPLLVFAADAAFRANDVGGAEELLRRAAREAPRDPLVALDLGLVLRQQGRDAEARGLLSRAAEARVAPLAARARRELAQNP